MALAERILKVALEEAGKHDAKHIDAISVQIGDSSFDDVDSLYDHLMSMARWTGAEGKRIEIKVVGPTFQCPQCGLVFEVNRDWPRCPGCEYKNIRALADRRLFSVTIKLDSKVALRRRRRTVPG